MTNQMQGSDSVHLAGDEAGRTSVHAAGKSATVTQQVAFRAATETPAPREPWSDSPALLFNQCDGYHHVFARFNGDGEFKGFYNWTGTEPYTPDFFCAWALLDDGQALHEAFARRTPPSAAPG